MNYFEDVDRDTFVERLVKYTDITVEEAEQHWYNFTEQQQMYPRLQAILIAYGDKR